MKNKLKILVIILLCFIVTGCIPKKLEADTITELHLFSGSAVDGYSYDYVLAENIILYQVWEHGDIENYTLDSNEDIVNEIKKYFGEYKFGSKDKDSTKCEMPDDCEVKYVSVFSDGKKYFVSKKEEVEAFDKIEKLFESLEKTKIETFE